MSAGEGRIEGVLSADMEAALSIYEHDPLYRFTEGEARELADELLRLRAELARVSTETERYKEALCEIASGRKWVTTGLYEPSPFAGRRWMIRVAKEALRCRRKGDRVDTGEPPA